jgi:hypothetical protein
MGDMQPTSFGQQVGEQLNLNKRGGRKAIISDPSQHRLPWTDFKQEHPRLDRWSSGRQDFDLIKALS